MDLCACSIGFTLFSTAVLTLQCAACPAARPFFARKCLRGAWDKEKMTACSIEQAVIFLKTNDVQSSA